MDKNLYVPDTAEKLMINDIPVVKQNDNVLKIIKNLSKGNFEDIHVVYVLSEDNKLLGEIPILKIFTAKKNETASFLMGKPVITVLPKTDQEKVVIEAVKYDLKSIPVVDESNYFLGAVTADKIIDVLHEEHLEDFLRSSGIRGKGSKIMELMTANFLDLVKSRMPWLIAGLLVVFTISFFTSWFEGSFRENIALVFFIPVITYMSGAISTQTETIFIRAITFMKINIPFYLAKEFILGIIIGSTLGTITGIFAFFLSNSTNIALVIGLSLSLSMSVATVLACIIPLILKSLKKDPAVGSGPFATALQDFVSIMVYLVVAAIIL